MNKVFHTLINGDNNQIKSALSDLEWSDKLWTDFANSAHDLQISDRSAIMKRLVHHFIPSYCENQHFLTVPTGLKRMLLMCNNSVCDVLGIGAFLAKAVSLGESDFVRTLLFDPKHNWFDRLSEFDLFCLCEMFDMLLFNLAFSDVYRKQKKSNMEKLYFLVRDVISSKAFFNLKWMTYGLRDPEEGDLDNEMTEFHVSEMKLTKPCNEARLYKCIFRDWTDDTFLTADNQEMKIWVIGEKLFCVKEKEYLKLWGHIKSSMNFNNAGEEIIETTNVHPEPFANWRNHLQYFENPSNRYSDDIYDFGEDIFPGMYNCFLCLENNLSSVFE